MQRPTGWHVRLACHRTRGRPDSQCNRALASVPSIWPGFQSGPALHFMGLMGRYVRAACAKTNAPRSDLVMCFGCRGGAATPVPLNWLRDIDTRGDLCLIAVFSLHGGVNSPKIWVFRGSEPLGSVKSLSLSARHWR